MGEDEVVAAKGLPKPSLNILSKLSKILDQRKV